MAGDWIKMRGSLATHPKVLKLAKIIAADTEVGRLLSTGYNGSLNEIVTRDVTRDITLASLLRVWCACNEHTSDGVWRGIDIDDLDLIAGVPGFGVAMESVGWAIPDHDSGTITFPNFLEYNAPAKNGGRSSAADRQKRYRERKKQEELKSRNSGAKRDGNSDATNNVTRDVTSVTREEKRREEKKEKNPPLSPQGGDSEFPPEFEQAWDAYPKRSGGNPKKSALKAWKARIKAGADPQALADGVARYARFCAVTGKTGTEFVKQASTFFGPDEHYLNDWTPPPPKAVGSGGATESPRERAMRMAAERGIPYDPQ